MTNEVDWNEITVCIEPILALAETEIRREEAYLRCPTLAGMFIFERPTHAEIIERRFGAKALEPLSPKLVEFLGEDLAQRTEAVKRSLRTKRTIYETRTLAQIMQWEFGMQPELVDDPDWPLPPRTFIEIAAYGEGSLLCLWRLHGRPASDWPIVLIGGEGELAICAKNAASFLPILRRGWTYEQLEAGTGYEQPLTSAGDGLTHSDVVGSLAAARAALDAQLQAVVFAAYSS